MIEVIDSKEDENSNSDIFEEEKSYPTDQYKYGFNDQFFDFFKDLQVFFLFIY